MWCLQLGDSSVVIQKVLRTFPPLLFLCLVLVVWHISVSLFQISPILLPGPLLVLQAFRDQFSKLTGAFIYTGKAAALGLSVSVTCGVLTGMVFSQSRWIRESCYPYAIFLQTVPIVAIAPLIITWFGYGFQSVVMVAAIISLFPIITATTTGLLYVDQDTLDLLRLYGASRWQVLWKFRLPCSLSYLITGLKTSSGLAVVGAIVGEYFTGYQPGQFGLGYYIFNTNAQLKISFLYASVITSTLLGWTFFIVITGGARLLLSKWLIHEESIPQ